MGDIAKLPFIFIETAIVSALMWSIAPRIDLRYLRSMLLSIPLLFIFLLLMPLASIWSVLLYATLLIVFRVKLFNTSTINAAFQVTTIFIIKYLDSLLAGISKLLLHGEYMGRQLLFISQDYTHLQYMLIFLLFNIVGYRVFINQIQKNSHRSFYLNRNLLLINLLLSATLFAVLNVLYRYFHTVIGALRAISGLVELLLVTVVALSILVIAIMHFINNNWMTQSNYDNLKSEAERDALTGIINRSSGMKRLATIYRQSLTSNRNFVICFIDVNNLKIVNDRYGHHEGDQMLKLIAKIIDRELRESDFVFRYGGDEFIAVFNDCKMEAASRAWQRINSNIQSANTQSGFRYHLSVSFGFSSRHTNKRLNLKELIDLADNQMYKYKNKYKSKLI